MPDTLDNPLPPFTPEVPFEPVLPDVPDTLDNPEVPFTPLVPNVLDGAKLTGMSADLQRYADQLNELFPEKAAQITTFVS